ncbi:Manganese ion homeostasis (Fr) [Penicillium taxi]|uniref:Manganese ion homeostasis (Fr) n=1 Tax=Penicillium taxi TaxID=168475 RepID=UPI002544FB16|nr:Manganese ion homeostasis (Fr) [Penicillium taxi]KAJ5900025.1 Manganese ion homeostasis (Fr) [Penicillium taxi]
MRYNNSRDAGSFSPSFTSYSNQSPNILNRVWDQLRTCTTQCVTIWDETPKDSDSQSFVVRMFKNIFTVANGVILLWILTLWWGERTVFQEHIDACVWQGWERWPQYATPYHVVFVADPQLVDPHTYPGRPWPLSTLTVKYTDQFMRRSFESIQSNLVPDSVLFLGDLFDGGREWATQTSSSPEARYKKIKDSFWKKEYSRFAKIFLNPWAQSEFISVDDRGRRLLANLPGNHDLGFGNGIQEPVRDRFQSYFGPSNRIDVIGNHSFVSVDTPSLSAKDQPDPLTGSSTDNNGEDGPAPIWKDAGDFINQLASRKAKAEMDELRMLQNQTEGFKFDYRVADATEDVIHQLPESTDFSFPTILLTHIPLYRNPATPCGPLRERYPPSSPDLDEDEPNSLKIAGGYQYQNVLTSAISADLVSKVGPNLVQVYSGDDHDYCEVVHREFNGSPREITVKSFSWAMGVRHPGFLLTSLWNPIDPKTGESTQNSHTPTLQNHLCLLPDQLGIFIHYLYILGFSITVLLAHSTYHALFTPEPTQPNAPVLPLSEKRTYVSEHHTPGPQDHTFGTSSSTLSSTGSLASRGGFIVPRYPLINFTHNAYSGPEESTLSESTDKGAYNQIRLQRPFSKLSIMGNEFYRSVKLVAVVVLSVYFFLIWRW